LHRNSDICFVKKIGKHLKTPAKAARSAAHKQAVVVTKNNVTAAFKILTAQDLKRERNSAYQYLIK
jgi:hypothetical protein